MKTTNYFDSVVRVKRPDIKMEWIETALINPIRKEKQEDGRFRFWCKVEEFSGRYLRVVTLEDGETVHNAFFDRRFNP